MSITRCNLFNLYIINILKWFSIVNNLSINTLLDWSDKSNSTMSSGKYFLENWSQFHSDCKESQDSFTTKSLDPHSDCQNVEFIIKPSEWSFLLWPKIIDASVSLLFLDPEFIGFLFQPFLLMEPLTTDLNYYSSLHFLNRIWYMNYLCFRPLSI